MTWRVQRIKFITREYVRSNPDKLFLFGDNLERRGFGGQAAAMRGEPNAIGIPTKKSPSNTESAFFSDDEIELNKAAIDAAFAGVLTAINGVNRENQIITIPADGLGTGRAQLEKRAPKTFAFLLQKLAELETYLR
ncbi:MAG: hypothetical protein WBO10_07260 [Pyrinomonadaceae bacterium]